jgi:HlyD family secretion protein
MAIAVREVAMISEPAADRPLAKPAIGRPWRRWMSAVLVGVAVLAGIGYVLRGWLSADRSVDRSRVRIAKVERGTLVRDVVSDGRVVAANSPTLYAIAAGTVEFRVRPGDSVKADQLLATIASPDLKSRLAQEQSSLAGLEANVGRAGLEVEHGRANGNKLIAQAEIDRQAAIREVEINKRMFERGVIPELELRRSEDALKKAEIGLQHARTEAGLLGKEAGFDLGTRKQSLDRQREVVRDLERQVAALELKSPVDGQVGQLLVPQRATVAANAALVTVVDLGAFELEIRVPDSFARDIAMGMSAEITSGTRKFAGRVRSVSPEVVDGTVATRLEFVDKRPEGLRQNQRLGARILIEEKANVLKVERGPFVESGGGNAAYVLEDGVAVRRTLKLGAIGLDSVEIVSGVMLGDEIVVGGIEAFGDATRVRIAN